MQLKAIATNLIKFNRIATLLAVGITEYQYKSYFQILTAK